MTATEQAILQALIDLEAAVASLPTANPKPDLLARFDHLDALARQLPAKTAPELLHYLQKKSYQKARLFLTGQDAENITGSCGRHV